MIKRMFATIAAIAVLGLGLVTVTATAASAHTCPHGDAHTVPHTAADDNLGRCLDATYASERMGATIAENVGGAVTILIFVVGVTISTMFLVMGIRRMVSRLRRIASG